MTDFTVFEKNKSLNLTQRFLLTRLFHTRLGELIDAHFEMKVTITQRVIEMNNDNEAVATLTALSARLDDTLLTEDKLQRMNASANEMILILSKFRSRLN